MKTQIFILLLFCGVLGSCESINSSVACDNNFFELNLNQSGIKYFKPFFIKSSKITHLNLQYNDIEKIENGAFDGLTNLRHLNLTGNKFSQSYFTSMENPTIETLVLDEAFNIPETKILISLETAYYDEYGRYRTRPAQYYYICNINISLPMKFQQLKALHLCRNNISRIIIDEKMEMTTSVLGLDMDSEGQLPDITHLYLSDNQIEDVSFLNNMSPTLKYLNLQNNLLTKFSVQTEIISTIEELLLDNNHIVGLCYSCDKEGSMSLRNALNLRKLSLSNNQISVVEIGTMEDLTSLVELDLSYNKIGENIGGTQLKNLKLLNLQNNRLNFVPDLSGSIKLEKLLLDNNMIEKIEEEFACLSDVKNISLSNNKIDFIKSGAFDTLTLLLELDLSSNRLSVLPDDWISAPRNLQSLHLNSNLFTSIDSMSLTNLTDSLKTMNIAGNPLRFFTLRSLNNLPENTTFEIDDFSKKIVG